MKIYSLSHSVFKKARTNGLEARFIGIVTMIGELFTYGLVSWNVINSGIFEELLPPQTSLDIEAVCKLLKISGHNFDKHHYKDINVVISNLLRYSVKYDFRTQCFVKEIDEMRRNDWKEKMKKEEPKTLRDIHREFNNEKNTGFGRNRKGMYRAQRDSGYGGRYYQNGYGGHGRGYQSRGGRWRNNNNNSYNGYNSRRKSKSLRPTVEFVKDVTLPDRTHFPGNKVLKKTWYETSLC